MSRHVSYGLYRINSLAWLNAWKRGLQPAGIASGQDGRAPAKEAGATLGCGAKPGQHCNV